MKVKCVNDKAGQTGDAQSVRVTINPVENMSAWSWGQGPHPLHFCLRGCVVQAEDEFTGGGNHSNRESQEFRPMVPD